MFSHGMLTALAASMAVRRRGLPPGSPPPLLAATVISRMTLVQEEARRASVTAFLRLICFHLLWPAMARAPLATRKHKCDSRLRQSGRSANHLTLAAPTASLPPL